MRRSGSCIRSGTVRRIYKGALKSGTLTHGPYPVAGVITPWNFPLGLSLCDAVRALLAGAVVVVNPPWESGSCSFCAPPSSAWRHAGTAGTSTGQRRSARCRLLGHRFDHSLPQRKSRTIRHPVRETRNLTRTAKPCPGDCDVGGIFRPGYPSDDGEPQSKSCCCYTCETTRM